LKKFITLSLIGISLSAYTLFEVNVLDFHHLFGKCSGSNAYCSGCKNCSGCKHCAKEGGSCAVCYTPRAVVRRSAPVKAYRSERSVSSNNSRSISSGSPAVKRNYLRKASSQEYTTSQQSIAVDQSKTEISSSKDSAETNTIPSAPSINKQESRNDVEIIYYNSICF